MADERRSFSPTPGNAKPKTARTALGEGLPPNVDVHRLGEGDNPQTDWLEPSDGPADEVAYGADHANRPAKTEAGRGQGPRTVERNREIVRGRLHR